MVEMKHKRPTLTSIEYVISTMKMCPVIFVFFPSYMYFHTKAVVFVFFNPCLVSILVTTSSQNFLEAKDVSPPKPYYATIVHVPQN